MDRQKVLLILGIAWISALILSWFFYTKTRAPQREKRTNVMAAARDLPLGSRLKKTDLKLVALSEKDVPKGAVLQDRDAVDRVLLYPVSANEPLTGGKLAGLTAAEGVPATIEPGKRAVSVQITDTSGVAGLVQPNSRVDVLFTRPGNMAEAITTTVLQDVRVLAVGRSIQAGQAVDPRAPKMPVATLILTPQEAQKLELAKNQGKISLSLRNPLDRSINPDTSPVTTEVLDPMVSARLARARRGRTTGLADGKVPDLNDPRVWEELTGERKNLDKLRQEEEARKRKEAEKPKQVVDVYRGDKHVQEIFP